MDVRPAAAEDLESLLTLQREVQQVHVDARPERYREPVDAELRRAMREMFEQADTTIFLAAEYEVTLGFAVVVLVARPEDPFHFAVRTARVDQFGVLESARRRGVGKALLGAIRDFARSQACERLELDVHVFNEGARRFYLAEGFETVRYKMVCPLDD